jgi:hypothetical protein
MVEDVYVVICGGGVHCDLHYLAAVGTYRKHNSLKGTVWSDF